MKSRIQYFVVISAVAFCLAFWIGQRSNQAQSRAFWEHKVVSELKGTGSVELNRLGAEGWELITVRGEEEVNGSFHQTRLYYYLKRQR